MTEKIFRSIFLVAVCSLLVCALIVFAVTINYYSGKLSDALVEEAKYVSAGVETGGNAYLSSIRDAELRVTWIAADGSVLYDNRASTEEMENHLDREEIRQAMQSVDGVGVATRYSGTLSERTTYYALRQSDGSVIRVSETQYSLWVIVMSTVQPILIVLAVAMVVAGILAARLSRSIVRPINELDLDHPEDAQVYEELSQIVRRLTMQNRRIHRQMEELKIKQTEFNAITSNLSEGMIIIDRNAEVLSSNACARTMLGMAPDSQAPKCILHWNTRDNFREAIRIALGGQNGYDTFQRGDRYYKLLVAPVTDSGDIIGAILVILDETEKEQRETLRREFTSNVSHELKTPLTSISGFAELIRDGMTEETDTRRFADMIYKEARRLISLVGDIIRLSQLDGGEIPYDDAPSDLYELAKETIQRLTMIAETQHIHLSLSGEHLLVNGNRRILEEMLYNLIDNGIKYNREGGYVKVSVHDQKKEILLCVSDNGIGIPKDQQNRVFERFYRVDKSHSKEIGGTGLGLSIVKHGAAYHKAQLSLESEWNVGTTVSLSFPKQ